MSQKLQEILQENSEFSVKFQESDNVSQETLESYHNFLRNSLDYFTIENLEEISDYNFLIQVLALKTLSGKFKRKFMSHGILLKLKTYVKENNLLRFGIMNVFMNLGKYAPNLSRQEKELKKLKKLSTRNTQEEFGSSDSEEESESQVQERNKMLLDMGVMEIITQCIKNDPSLLLSDTVSTTLLNLLRDYSNRGKIVQEGGLKVLKKLLKTSSEKGIKDARQGLARVLISIDPSLLFRGESEVLEVVGPLVELCKGEDTLSQFEALLALTNLASIGPEIQTRICKGETIKMFEHLIFSDNTLIRRAATELVCNLMYEPSIFERYVNCDNSSRLKLVVALSDCEDFETRRAASGILAILSSSKDGLLSLSKEPRFFPVLSTLLQDDSIELLHRSFETLKNCLTHMRETVPSDLLITVQGPVQKHIQENSNLKPLALELQSQITNI